MHMKFQNMSEAVHILKSKKVFEATPGLSS